MSNNITDYKFANAMPNLRRIAQHARSRAVTRYGRVAMATSKRDVRELAFDLTIVGVLLVAIIGAAIYGAHELHETLKLAIMRV